MRDIDVGTQGFTLLEIIIFLIVSSIVGTMLVTYSLSARHAVSPLTSLSIRNRLETGMETVVIAYKKALAEKSLVLSDFRAHAESLSPGGVTISTQMVTLQAGDPSVLKVTVSLEGQSLCALFTQ
jgi:hypothetical protein